MAGDIGELDAGCVNAIGELVQKVSPESLRRVCGFVACTVTFPSTTGIPTPLVNS